MDKNDQLLFSLILQYQQLAMMALGKVARPGDGMRTDLEEAAYFIDVLAMLEDKTRDRLPDELVRMLTSAVTDLRLNFVDEKARLDAVLPAAATEGDA
ncbi:MAG: DUF1844 domain-containing protein [bacterium]|nr:DUF1844 domain-containing protein [bacterium]